MCEIERSETGVSQGQWDYQRDGDVSVIMSDPRCAYRNDLHGMPMRHT